MRHLDLRDAPYTIEVNLTRLENDLWDAGYSRDQIAMLLWAINRGLDRP